MSKRYYVLVLTVVFISCTSSEERFTNYGNGNIKSKWTLVDGKVEGDFVTYYESGKIESRVPYLNDKRNGVATYYYEEGPVSAKTNFVDGMENGVHYGYNLDGKLKLKAFFKNDLQDSITIIYLEESRADSLEVYYIQGTHVWEREYKNGQVIKNPEIEFYTVKLESDTVKKGDELSGEIHLLISNLDKFRVILGNLDNSGNLIDTLQIIDEYERYKVKFSLNTEEEVGHKVLSGVIQEIHEKSGRYILKPFKQEYFVEE